MRILLASLALLLITFSTSYAQDESIDRDPLAAGQAALSQNNFSRAARAFQRAVDLNPSSADAHEGLGTALLGMLAADRVSAARETDTAERAEDHLKQAAQLSPSDTRPLLKLADLEALLASIATDPEQRADHFRAAREAISSTIHLGPPHPALYLRLANLEREEFGPVLDIARSRYSRNTGPIPDATLRRHLAEQYSTLIDDAIHNAQTVAEMSGHTERAYLLLSRLFRQRALLRDTPEQYTVDMQKAADYERQFLASGGHLGDSRTTAH